MAAGEDGNTILSVTWVLGSIATFSLGTRIYTRFFFQRQDGWDDYVIIIAWVRLAGRSPDQETSS